MEEILKITSIVFGVLSGTVIPFVIATVKNFKAKKALEFINDATKIANDLIVCYETKFWDISQAAKNAGVTIGGLKKEMVLSALKEKYAEENTPFDISYWSNYIDKYIAESRKINSAVKTVVTDTNKMTVV